MRNYMPPMDTTSERERRLQLALADAGALLPSVVGKLNLALEIASTGPRTSQELIWRLQAVSTIQLAGSLRRSIALLEELREDVAAVQP